eukprot:1216659-Amphidinium_carterae.1
MRRSSEGVYSRGLDGWVGAEIEGSTGSSGFQSETHPDDRGWEAHRRSDVLGDLQMALPMQIPKQTSANSGGTATWAASHMCRVGSRTDSRSLHPEMSAASLGQIF